MVNFYTKCFCFSMGCIEIAGSAHSAAMERWLMLAFQVGHVCRSLGDTLLVIHEVTIHGTHNGRPAFPKRGPFAETGEDFGAEREAREGKEDGGFSEDGSNQAETPGTRSGHPGRAQETPAPVIVTEPSNGQDQNISMVELADLVVDVAEGDTDGAHVKESNP